MRTKIISIQIIAVYGMFMAAGCSTPQMVVPADVVGVSEVLNVTDRSNFSGALVDESFKLGSYVVNDVDRDWNSKSTRSISDFSAEKTTGGYSYSIKGESGAAKGQCLIEGNKKGVALLGGIEMSKSVAKLGCQCQIGDHTVEVILESRNDSKFKGTLSNRTSEYQIEAIYDRKGSIATGDPSGYRVDGDGPISAVEVLRPGRVWLAKKLTKDTRDELVCLSVGLMLYQPTKKD